MINKPIVVFGSVALSNIYIEEEFNEFIKIEQITNTLQNDLRFDWDFEINNTPYMEAFSRSKSSYQRITFREIIAAVRINEDYIKELNGNNEEMSIQKNAKVYFFRNGNVVLLTKYEFEESFQTIKSYEDTINTLHKNIPMYLKKIFWECVDLYRQTILKCNYRHIFTFNEKIYENNIDERTMRFSIVNHFFNHSIDQINQFFESCETIHTNEVITNDKMTIRLGWTHSIFMSKDKIFEDVYNVNLYSMYLLIILANWAGLDCLRFNLLNIEKYYNCNIFNKKVPFREITKIKDVLNRYVFKIKEVFNTLDSYQSTNHPKSKYILNMYQKVFEEKEAAQSVNNKIDLLMQKINYLHDNQKGSLNNSMNMILFILATISVISTVDLIYKIISDYPIVSSIIIFAVSIVSLFVIFILVFKHRLGIFDSIKNK